MSRIKEGLLAANLVAMLLLGGALASAHGGDTTRVHACVRQDGTIRLDKLA